jgi:hypothetical protein
MEILRKILYVLLVSVFVFAGLKGCMHSSVGLDYPNAYQNINSNGTISRIFTISHNEFILTKYNDGNFEIRHFRVRGHTATHYFGSLLSHRIMRKKEKCY